MLTLLRVTTAIAITVSSISCLCSVANASDLNNFFVPSGNDLVRTGSVIELSWPDVHVDGDSLLLVLWNGEAGSQEVPSINDGAQP